MGKALIAAAVLSLVLAGCGSDNNIGTPATSSPAIDCGGKDALTGEGSTAQQNAIALFNQAWARFCPRKNVSYNPTGSGAGREQFVAGHVDFAGSDSPLTAEQAEPATKRCNGNPAWHLPLVFGPVAVAYHLDGVNPLVVNADVLAKIFTGKITNWRDPAIAALNRGVTLPDIDIAPIYRSDSSGTTDNFQKYLGAAAPQSWTKGAGSEFQGGVGEGVQKSAGVVQAVQSTPGAVAYVEKGFADQASLTYAQIDDGGGAVALSDDAARNAIDDAKFAGAGNDLRLDLNSLYGTKEPGAYPLVLVTYEIVCSKGYDSGISTALKSFLTAAADYGQQGLSPAGYIPLPDRFKQRLVAAIGAIQ
ncbi:phosphate ABC transporter substrate-binding protein PstS [Mycobacterium branderi]|uniref:Phosphate-binding protein n=1 Tax=Mycobacterium branderi TaxID=43348 RepID=A0ABM7KLI0_9MYCO|nr:phosphate ABC transporter substrate-binding protein PstS [Mycobacterium branderi]BBZ12027.1 phosphate-binding protein PstS [Mycobacterium branderi]